MNYFELLSLPVFFSIDEAKLKQQYFALQQQYHPDKAGIDAMQQSMEINQAYQTLKDPLKRAQYMLSLEGVMVGGEQDTVKPDMELLEEMMEMREAMMGADGKEEKEALLVSVKAKINECIAALGEALANHELERAAQLTLRLSYLYKASK